ncbi:MAG: hypothetical protein ACOC1F_00575 [Myxococcota bacterium]
MLQAAVRVASQVLDIQHPELGSLDTLAPHADTDSILAQLIIDRGRELSELITCYRITLHPPASVFRLVDPDDAPF